MQELENQQPTDQESLRKKETELDKLVARVLELFTEAKQEGNSPVELIRRYYGARLRGEILIRSWLVDGVILMALVPAALQNIITLDQANVVGQLVLAHLSINGGILLAPALLHELVKLARINVGKKNLVWKPTDRFINETVLFTPDSIKPILADLGFLERFIARRDIKKREKRLRSSIQRGVDFREVLLGKKEEI